MYSVPCDNNYWSHTAQKNKFSIEDFFIKCDQLQIWSHLLKKSLIENFIFFCAVTSLTIYHMLTIYPIMHVQLMLLSFHYLYYDKKNWSEHLLLYLEQPQKQWLWKASQKYGDVMLIVILFLINLVWQQPTQMLKKLSASDEVVRSIFWYDLQKF